ncbi:deoxyguanosinetriphosphate triphosphohydrolase-like protein [Candidatus Magnetoovum chiemensis]|nr:deoxyguanosinetriphosphate triphosphohydrolase-like protein [Candidatus Magnetoovum chiemensis]
MKQQTIRQQIEDREKQILHPNACLSVNSRGRENKEDNEDTGSELRTCFQRDRDRIIHSKSFRRLKHKTQVFLAPKGDHYRTRLTHVLEVSQIARTIARALRLNEDLTEAISLGHDIGHTPFGHAGEAALQEIHPHGFNHYKQSLRVVEFLEKNGKGLNLTLEVRDGIVKHSKGKGSIMPNKENTKALTFEGQLVRFSDIIAYVNHDLDDALRAEVIKEDDIPKDLLLRIGRTHAKRIDTMVKDLVYTTLSQDMNQLCMSDEMLQTIDALRKFLFERVYESKKITDEFKKAKKILKELYLYYLENSSLISNNIPVIEGETINTRVCDFIAGMTDRFALLTYEGIYIPKQWI